MSEIHVRIADWQKDNADLRRIREAVFIAEQSVSPEQEWDAEDADAVHFLALEHEYAIDPVTCGHFQESRAGLNEHPEALLHRGMHGSDSLHRSDATSPPHARPSGRW